MSGIYLYWEGDRRHWYYDLCLETVRAHNPTARVLTRRDVEGVLGPLPRELDDVYVTHRVDWIRKAFVARAGGLWLDMDFVCLKPLGSLVGLAADFDYVGFREWHGSWMDNFFVARPGSVILGAAAEYALGQVREYGANMGWLSASTEAIEHAFARHPWCAYLQIPTHLVSPVSVMEPHWFCGDLGGDDLGQFDVFGFMTSFHGLRGWLEGQTRDQFLSGPSRLADLVRRALA
ncbi:hypothetical protein VT84_07300 [Gemmata sp. SH-PL17]|uniref:hypothetical protein n=1 Tax=Gemmata sp. SH-PL17 TaxID=1630693 RepID=UPI00078C051B|nr:hypothetical protein [Gemmata sp. SH-PL17]AMV24186.1 hypothetical protein VT84_07300 [Gemmata sp. SH-PL17]